MVAALNLDKQYNIIDLSLPDTLWGIDPLAVIAGVDMFRPQHPSSIIKPAFINTLREEQESLISSLGNIDLADINSAQQIDILLRFNQEDDDDVAYAKLDFVQRIISQLNTLKNTSQPLVGEGKPLIELLQTILLSYLAFNHEYAIEDVRFSVNIMGHGKELLRMGLIDIHGLMFHTDRFLKSFADSDMNTGGRFYLNVELAGIASLTWFLLMFPNAAQEYLKIIDTDSLYARTFSILNNLDLPKDLYSAFNGLSAFANLILLGHSTTDVSLLIKHFRLTSYLNDKQRKGFLLNCLNEAALVSRMTGKDVTMAEVFWQGLLLDTET